MATAAAIATAVTAVAAAGVAARFAAGAEVAEVAGQLCVERIVEGDCHTVGGGCCGACAVVAGRSRSARRTSGATSPSPSTTVASGRARGSASMSS